MKFLRQQIAGVDVPASLSQGRVFPYKYSETVETGFDDVTDIVSIHKYSIHTDKDFVFASAQIKTLFDAKTGADEDAKWSNCSAEEKKVLAERFLVSDPKINEQLTAPERIDCFAKIMKESQESRDSRIKKAMVVIGQILTNAADRVDLFNSVALSLSSYVNTGGEDLVNYMNSSAPYDNTTGFAGKSYFLQAIVDQFNSIVVDGE